MVTDFTFKVEEILVAPPKGEGLPKEIVLTYWGGTLDGETQTVSDLRLPVPGERLIAMLRPGWQKPGGLTPVVGFNQGLFLVTKEVSGATIVRNFDGDALAVTETGQVIRRHLSSSLTPAPAVSLQLFKQWLRDNHARIKAAPSEIPPQPDPSDPRLIKPSSKIPESKGGPDKSVPASREARTEPGIAAKEMPASPETVITAMGDAGQEQVITRTTARRYSTAHQARLPIVVNNFPDSFTPWSPEDEYQMSKWNYYASGVFRVYTTPTGTYGWRNNVFDLAGWPSSDDTLRIYGYAWESNTIGITFLRYDANGWIIEADIALNPAFGFTLDDEWVYDGSTAQSYRQVMIHELGHMHGLEHEFNYLSLMNYMPAPYRSFTMPYADDAEGIRFEYSSQAVSLTDLGVYLYYASGFQSVTAATFPSSVAAGGSLTVNNYTVENVGTATIATPRIQWYLTSARHFGSSYYYLGESTYSSLPRFTYFTPNTVSRTFTVPGNVPSGEYYLAAYVDEAGGVGQSSFPFRNNNAFSRTKIRVSGATVANDNLSDAVTISGSMGAVSGSNVGATKQSGEPNHAGNVGGASIWWRWTAPSSGAVSINTFGSGFDTLLAVYTGVSVEALTAIASNDDSDGTRQSSVSFIAQEGVTYLIAVDGYNGVSGVVALSWNLTTARFALTLVSNPAAGGAITAIPDPGGDGKYAAGTVVNLTATANAGYGFASWGGDASGTGNPVQVTVSADRNVTANFVARHTLTVLSNPSGGGSVSASPEPETDGKYAEGTVVTLTANASSGFSFSSWSGDASGTANPLQVTMSADRSVTAKFVTSGTSSATRNLPENYTAGIPVVVSIAVEPNAATSAYALEDGPPAGWVVSSVDNGGVWDAVNKKVKWGPFFDNTPRTVNYQATPPQGTIGAQSFAGIASFDGVGVAIGGDQSISDGGPQPRYRLILGSSPVAGGTINASPAAEADGKYAEGTVVTLTANASAGFVFSTWSGDASGTTNPLQVTMSADRSVTANFTEEEIVLPSGIYNGLVRTETAAHQTSGFVTLTLSKKQSFTGALWYAGKKYAIRGRFDIDGEFHTAIKRRNLSSLSVALAKGIVDGEICITGTVQDGTSTAGAVAYRAAYDAKRNPAPQAGRYTIISEPLDKADPEHPEGYGCGTLIVNNAGGVRVVKRLGDGSKITHSAFLSERNVWPLYAALYKGNGSVLGLMRFVEGNSQRDMGGSVSWFKLPNPRDKFYPSGFTTESDFLAARYTAPSKGNRVLDLVDAPNNARLMIAGGGMQSREVVVTVARNNKVVAPPGEGISLTIVPGTGAFSGKFPDPTSGKKKTFSGSIYQKTNIGVGLFSGNGAYGRVRLEGTIPVSNSSVTPIEWTP